MIGSGKGMFIWYRGNTEGGDIARTIQEAKAMGLSHVQIKFGDGPDLNKIVRDRWSDSVLLPLVEAFYNAGINVWAWQYIYNYSPAAEAAYIAKRLHSYKQYLSGFLIDAEAECKVNRGGAKEYMQTLRRSMPDMPVGLCSYRFPEYHRDLDWRTFADYSDMWWPQVYWEQSHNPSNQLQSSVNQLFTIKHMPVIPVGSAYGHNGWDPSVADLDGFSAKAKSLGLAGISWWYWKTVAEHPAWKRAITNHAWPVSYTPVVIPPVDTSFGTYRVSASLGMKIRSEPDATQNNQIGSLAKNKTAEISLPLFTRLNETWGRIRGDTVQWVCVQQGKRYPYMVRLDA